MERYYTISICGQDAVDAGYRFCDGYCYRKMPTFGQLEVVVDEPGEYNGLPKKWVSVSYIRNGKDIEAVLRNLRMVGFGGMVALISECVESDCYANETDLCCVII